MEQKRLGIRSGALLLAACGLGAGVPVCAQERFPQRPVRMVNPFTPGGTVDIVGRAVAAGVSEQWGQQVIVDNRPGAGTTIGTEIVVRAEPDGYTVLVNSSAIAIMTSLYKKLRFDPGKDLRAIAQGTNTPSLLTVYPGLGAKSVKQLIELARAQPGRIPAASSGTGSTTHLKLELFKSLAKVDLIHVPYKGGGPAIADLIGGQVGVFFNPPGAILPHVKTGRLLALGITSRERVPYLPDLPTIAEAGVPGYEAYIWYGFYAPKATPDALVQRWNAAINTYFKTPQARQHFDRVYMTIVGGSPEAFAEYHASETIRWAEVIRSAGLTGN